MKINQHRNRRLAIWLGGYLLAALLLALVDVRTVLPGGNTPTFTPTPDCSTSLLRVEFDSFLPNGLVKFQVTTGRRVTALLRDFSIAWRQPANTRLRLALVALVTGPDEDDIYPIWESDSRTEDRTPPTLGRREGEWLEDYFFEPGSTTDMYLVFDGTEASLDMLGLTEADFEDTILCATRYDGGTSNNSSDPTDDDPGVNASETFAFTETPTSEPTATITSTSSSQQISASDTPTPIIPGVETMMVMTAGFMTSQAQTQTNPEPIYLTATALAQASAGDDPTPTPEGGAQLPTEQTTAAVVAVATDTPPRPTLPPTWTPTPLPTASLAQPTASSTPLVIADASVLVRSDVSGQVIGDGTLRIYAPSSVRYPETLTVELELHLDNLYITPTPNGLQGTPVPRATSSAANLTATPRLPILTDSGLLIYQRMGATLLCSEQSFEGCDAERNFNQAKLVTSSLTRWSWILTPQEIASGLQNLNLEVWIIQRNLDGGLEYLDIEGGQYSLQIEVNPAGGGLNPAVIVLGLAGLAVIVGGLVMWQRGSKSEVASLRSASSKSPLVFISYRRGPSWGQARSIEQSLRQRGANVFIDIDDINEGHFAEIIEKAIKNCDYFVVVLAPGTLESEWVKREIQSALSLGKTIIPLLVDKFVLDKDQLPEDIQDIASHNAITLLPEFYEEAMNRLAKRFLRLN
ncbi:MAG: toll/interleukin-1 receptor domain-containing protein [Anaerolineae bacterium]|nr:toll/interleukin-1 receptor domain-containing protein [Anaerolineae bacterium]